MITERLQHVIDELASMSPEEQDQIGGAIQAVLHQPSVTSDTVRPEVMEAFEQVMTHSTEVLDYLRDK